MKKLKLLFAAFALLFSAGMQAQTWVPSEVGEGYALLYNVGTGQYFTRGNGWNSQASVGGEGSAMTVYLEAHDGKYKIRTQNSYGLECLSGGTVYTDQSRGKTTTWTFTEVDATNHVYNIISADNHGDGSGKYLTAEGGESTIVGPGNDGTNANAQWKICLHEDRPASLLTAMNNATTEPVDVTCFIKDANFGSFSDIALQCWTVNASNKNLNGGRLTNPCAETFKNGGGTFSQTITVPNGTYLVKCQGFYDPRSGDTPSTLFANNETPVSLKKFNANGEGHTASMDGASDAFTAGNYENEIQVTVTGKSLTIGIEGNDGNWTCFDNFRLLYLAPIDLSSFETALADALTDAKAISGMMNADVATALASAISTYDGKTYDNEDDYTTAINALNTAITNANTSVANYAAVKAAIDQANTNAATLDETGQAAFDISAIETAYNNRTITDGDYATYITDIATALRTAAKAQTTEGADMTLAIVNPGIDGNANGWTTDINGNGGYAGGPMKPSNDAMEFWGAGTLTDQDKGKSFDYYQIIKDLPAGIYKISADMLNSTNGEEGADWNGGGKAGLYANTSTAEVKVLITNDGQDFVNYTTDEITVIDGELRIGVKNFESLTGRWFACDNFKLTYVGPIQDLTPYVTAYETAKTAAQTTSDKTDKMAASIRTELNNTIAAEVDQTSQEALVNATNALNAITAKAETSLASYAVIATGVIPDNSLDGWVCETKVPGQDIRWQVNTWSSEGNNDGSNMKTPFLENWTNRGNFLGVGKVYYKLEGLEPGEQYYAQALVRSYNEANADAPNGPDFFINDQVTKLSEEGTTFTYNNMSGIYATLEGFATVGADGTLTLGIDVAENRNYNWVAFKSVKIQTLGAALDDATTELGTAVDAANAAAATKSGLLTTIAKAANPDAEDVTYQKFIGGSEGAAFAAALAAANNVDATYIPAVRTAKANLETATAAYVAAAPAYERAAMVIAIAPAYNVDVTNLQQLVATQTTTGNDVAAASNTIMSEFATMALASQTAKKFGFEKDEYAPYNNVEGMQALATAKAMSEAPANFTNALLYETLVALKGYVWTANTEEVNAFYDGDFSESAEDNASPLDYIPAGWTASQNMRMMLKNAETYPGLADASATSAMMSWSGGITYGETAGYDMPLKENTVYKLKLKAAGWNNETRSGISVSVLYGEDGLALTDLGTSDRDIKGNENNTAGLTQFEKIFKTGAAGNYVFHVQSGNNMVLTDFELVKAVAEDIEISENADYTPAEKLANVTLTRTIKEGVNTLVLPFSMSQAEVESTFGVDSEVYTLKSYDAGKENLSFELSDGIIPNKPCLLKATEAGTSYNIEGRTIVAIGANDTPEIEVTGAKMVGTYAASIYAPQGSYIISGGKIYNVDSEVALKNTRAYIELTNGDASRALTFSLDDETTGIATLKNGELKIETGDIYDLSGRRVNAPAKGVYIINGKKVVK